MAWTQSAWPWRATGKVRGHGEGQLVVAPLGQLRVLTQGQGGAVDLSNRCAGWIPTTGNGLAFGNPTVRSTKGQLVQLVGLGATDGKVYCSALGHQVSVVKAQGLEDPLECGGFSGWGVDTPQSIGLFKTNSRGWRPTGPQRST